MGNLKGCHKTIKLVTTSKQTLEIDVFRHTNIKQKQFKTHIYLGHLWIENNENKDIL